MAAVASPLPGEGEGKRVGANAAGKGDALRCRGTRTDPKRARAVAKVTGIANVQRRHSLVFTGTRWTLPRAGAKNAATVRWTAEAPLRLGRWWRGLDSNQRRVSPTDLQSVAPKPLSEAPPMACGFSGAFVLQHCYTRLQIGDHHQTGKPLPSCGA